MFLARTNPDEAADVTGTGAGEDVMFSSGPLNEAMKMLPCSGTLGIAISEALTSFGVLLFFGLGAYLCYQQLPSILWISSSR